MWDWFLVVMRQPLEFNGRARRAEFWSFWAVSCAFSIALGMLVSATRDIDNETIRNLTENFASFYRWAIWLPGLSVGARRMHDIGRSGWWQFVPIAGQIMLFFDGERHENKYGPDPKAPLLSRGDEESPQLGTPG